MVAMSGFEDARPRSRRFWGDARFLLGILLIGASIVGVWFVVTAARQTSPAYAAVRTLVPGQSVTAEDVRVVDVALGMLGDSYLAPTGLAEGAVATRTVGEGELLPADAVGDARSSSTTNVVLRTEADVSSAVAPGARVEVWHAPKIEREGYDVPRILVADATVAVVTKDEPMVGGARATLEVVVPRDAVAAVLAAQSSGAVLSVVPLSGEAG